MAEIFATLLHIYLTANDDIKEVIESMSRIMNDPAADEDERNAALDTLVDVLFPPTQPEELGVGLEEMEDGGSAEAGQVHVAMAAQEATFADVVLKLMKELGITQKVCTRPVNPPFGRRGRLG